MPAREERMEFIAYCVEFGYVKRLLESHMNLTQCEIDIIHSSKADLITLYISCTPHKHPFVRFDKKKIEFQNMFDSSYCLLIY